MDIKIIKNKSELQGTCYMELLPSEYNGKCWNDTSIFFDEEVFGFFEPIIEKHDDSYEHYQFTNINKNTWLKIIIDLESVIVLLEKETSNEELTRNIGFLFTGTESEFFENLDTNKNLVVKLLQELISWLKEKLETNESITILGI